MNDIQLGLSRRTLIKRAAAAAVMTGLPAWFMKPWSYEVV
jgi:hypothetical protein